MNLLEQMEAYIRSTAIPRVTATRYDMDDLQLLAMRGCPGFVDAICLAFRYGRAKGYRAAKAEMKKNFQREREE